MQTDRQSAVIVHVRFGSQADMCSAKTRPKRHVRFTPKSGHVRCTSLCMLWANSGHVASVLRTVEPFSRVIFDVGALSRPHLRGKALSEYQWIELTDI